MRESHEIGSQVLVFENPSNRSRAEFGERGIYARPATIEEETTPHGSKWDPWAPVPGGRPGQYGAYVDDGPQGPKTYRVVFEDGSTGTANVHVLMVPAEAAPTIGPAELAARRAAESERQAEEERQLAAEAERQRAAAKAIQQF